MNDDLRSVGCFTVDSTRVAPRSGGSDLYSINYKSAYWTCDGRDDIYKNTGTSTPEEAAAWIAEDSVPGDAYDGSYDGCLDALLGRPNRFADQ